MAGMLDPVRRRRHRIVGTMAKGLVLLLVAGPAARGGLVRLDTLVGKLGPALLRSARPANVVHEEPTFVGNSVSSDPHERTRILSLEGR